MADDDHELRDADYERLLEFRTGLRRFLRWSEAQSATVGLTPAHHQLMLAVRGHGDPLGPTIRDVADTLLLQHHSVVGLVDRAVTAGLVDRHADPDDHRVVRLQLTALGERRLRQLSRLHLEELRRLAPRMRSLWADLDASTVGATG
jgi:DNA-binding MarR family transcriptional regulator